MSSLSLSLSEIRGLEPAEVASLKTLVDELDAKRFRGTLRNRYYDSKQIVQQLGISIPPSMRSIETVIGWPSKSVDALEQRIDLEGFVIPGADWSDFGLDALWSDNRLELESSQAHTSALKLAVTFVAVLAGDPKRGEPEVVIRPLSALSSTAIWNPVSRRVEVALSVTSESATHIEEFILYTPSAVVTCTKTHAGWDVDRRPHKLGRAPVAVLPFRPSLERPFGSSRISRAVMSITDRAVRTLLRSEVSAEFYSSPQRYVLGASESDFVGANGEPKTGWESMLSKVLVLDYADDGTEPKVGQFPQMTMQPHMDMVRADAALFSGETGIPVNSLGIIHDNPASDAAMQTAYLDLVKAAERAHVPFGIGWVDAMRMAVQVRDGLETPPDELRMMRARFRNPATSTRSEAANSLVTLASIRPGIAQSDVLLEEFGFDQSQIERIKADERRSQVGSLVSSLRAAASQVSEPAAEAASRRV